MKGLKFRAGNAIVDLALKAFGASTVSVPFTELYMALRSGVADGQENPLALINSSKFYEAQKYCTIIDYMFTVEFFYVNLDWWKSLPAEYQEILKTSAKEMMDETSRIVQLEQEKYIENIRNYGCEITFLTKEERDAFKPYAEEVWKSYIASGKMTKAELDTILGIVGKSVSW
jgi:C4-dicarboxylate-binding protein DctP